ncbi:poly(rC)-binding protein 2-like [Gigantopelta aegis]|uniref:poly(rC)-binding protein 2-like n=1 Tax=Gigantopelta aegis TaxID=1735272 RepID=UPI001B888254|nr:poly(rC)-binding protein 2-like [Gigantopelta aegis]
MATEHNNNMVQNDNSTTILTIRMIMQGKEVGSIIGKKGDNIKKFREDSGAKINISDGSCPERIVTTTGSIDNIHKAFTMICNKFEEDLQNTPTVPKPPVTLRLVVPASQCGSLIGKGGCKIKEIRESTGASIQVASEMLPNSTERAVTISGTAEAITECVRQICSIMLESPPKGANIPYRPKPVVSPVIFAGGQAYTVQNQMAAPVPSPEVSIFNTFRIPYTILVYSCWPSFVLSPFSFARQLSGAIIKISNADEGSADRKVTITGTADTIGLAQYLINTSMEMHKNLTLDPASTQTTSTLTSVQSHAPMAIPLSQMMKPMPLLGLNFGVLEAATDHKNVTTHKMRVGVMPNSANTLKKAERPKFAPY